MELAASPLGLLILFWTNSRDCYSIWCFLYLFFS